MGDLGSRVIGFFISVYLARVLGPAGFGLISIGLAVLGYLQLATSPGIQALETRNTAAIADVDHPRVSAVLSMRLVLAAALWILTALVAIVFLPVGETRDVILLFALSVFPMALMLDWFFQGKEVFFALSSSRVAQYVAYGTAVFLFVHGMDDVRVAAIAFGIGAAVAMIVLWIWYTRRWGAIRLQWSPKLWKEIFTEGVPVGAAIFVAQSVTNLPPLVIGYFSGTGDVGLFSSAMKLVFLMMLVDRVLNALFLPAATRYFSFQKVEVPTLVDITLRVVLLLVVPVGVCGAILSNEIVLTVFGGEYFGASQSLQVLMAFFILTVMNSVFVCVLVASGNERRYTKMVMAGSAILCVATIVGTASYGALGAAWGVVFGELVTTLMMGREVLKVVRLPLRSILVRPFVAGACMCGVAALLSGVNSFGVAGIAILVFIVVESGLKAITLKEIQFLKERFV